jgi:hypothetical protein
LSDFLRLVTQQVEELPPRFLLQVGADKVPDLQVLLVGRLGHLEVAELGDVLIFERRFEPRRPFNKVWKKKGPKSKPAALVERSTDKRKFEGSIPGVA